MNRKRQLSLFWLIVIGAMMLALTAAVFAAEDGGDLWSVITGKGDEVGQEYLDYWPTLSEKWDERFRQSRENMENNMTPTPIPTENP